MVDRFTNSIVDLYVDVSYGTLILIGAMAIYLFDNALAAVTFGVGVILAYIVHVAWRMVRFDPDTVGRIEEAVDESVEEHVTQMEDEVTDTIEESVDEHMEGDAS